MPNSDPRLVDQAIQWMIKLRFNVADDASTAAFDRWLHTSAEHQQVWQRVATMNDDFNQLPAQVGRHALQGARQRISRREGLKLLGLVAGAAGLTWLGRDYTPLPGLMADYRTATGERRWVALDDGSKIQLNSASAFDATFSAERRLVHLHRGEMLVNTGVDDRPLWVQTRDGYLRALASRFLVREEAQGTLLAVQQGAVALFANSREANARHVLKPGEQVLFDHTGIHAPIANGLDPWGWSDGVISAHNMRLDDFLSELSRYRNGLLRCSEAVAGLRVSGTYQLNDTDQVLSLVAQSLPVDVTYRSRYWVTVSPRV
ncbi:FecR domain-containing protein [Pseudomonas sp. 13B_2.1_Bac1]|uniref:FecR domain-containing protein n=1 Tax=Pseudomonas sp. 13B_2.1_Bac1 TaxID=2971624 RepID=UPI0021CAB3CD|nr:FecR domain-containing protein [Pseudomonas sp. 13B_2.1_Bac1]MCU1785711.1 FecR domain-containing protein [Pseudomonas sp. 13B_2.1_Bac1]